MHAACRRDPAPPGLDFSRQEAQRYVAYAVKPPPKYPGFDVKRASAALDAILAPAGDDDGQERTQDTEALVVLNVSTVPAGMGGTYCVRVGLSVSAGGPERRAAAGLGGGRGAHATLRAARCGQARACVAGGLCVAAGG